MVKAPSKRCSLRITPAWAGKSGSHEHTISTPEDHPRVGGEKLGQDPGYVAAEGSPPRGRGKAPPITSLVYRMRITPAWAGKRENRRCQGVGDADHPRVGGEKLKSGPILWKRWGSPPRGRGKVEPTNQDGKEPRITPAWAGKSIRSRPETAGRRDHPRVGGEKIGRKTPAPALAGITPAWAGKRERKVRDAAAGKDHPRVGGEKCLPDCSLL